MKRALWVIAGVSAGLLLGSSVVAPYVRDDLLQLANGIAERNDGTDLADKLLSPEAVLDYIVAHPQQVALASWELGKLERGIFFNADRPQPAAAAAQLITLTAYAEQLASGELRDDERVPLAAWSRHVIPSTDGGAHQSALHEARGRSLLLPQSDSHEPSSDLEAARETVMGQHEHDGAWEMRVGVGRSIAHAESRGSESTLSAATDERRDARERQAREGVSHARGVPMPGGEVRASSSQLLAAGAADAGVVGQALPLSAVVRALVRHGDPAAADFLLERLGRERVESVGRRAGLGSDAAPLPRAGLPLSWLMSSTAGAERQRAASNPWLQAEPAAELLARYRALGAQGYADAAWSQLARLRDEPAFRDALRAHAERTSGALSLRERAQLAAALPPHGTARGYASLASWLASAQLPRGERVRALLEAAPESGDFEQLGRLPGSQPGVSVSISYARVRGAGTKVLALFFRDLPLAVWLRLSAGFLSQQFEARLLSDEDFFAEARARLGVGERPALEARPDMHTRAD